MCPDGVSCHLLSTFDINDVLRKVASLEEMDAVHAEGWRTNAGSSLGA